MDLSWKTVKISGRPSSMNVDVDSSRDSNVGANQDLADDIATYKANTDIDCRSST